MHSHHRGFTLTETLVALVAGLVMVSSVMVFAVSAVRSNAQIVAGARLLEQMRRSLDRVTADIRRAGYYGDAGRFAADTLQAGLADVPVIRTSSCLVVRYDHGGAEFHGYRRAARNGVGVIQTTITRGIEPDCAAPATGGLWSDITDPAAVDVLAFSLAPSATIGGCTSMDGFAVIGQYIEVLLKARVVGDAAIERALTQSTRVRNDIMTSGSCT